jgi:hypothetical protein
MLENMTKEEQLEDVVSERLVLYPRTFMNQYGEFLPLMRNAVQCDFAESGHGFDILALDTVNWNLWVIEVSAEKLDESGYNQFLVKTLENRPRSGAKARLAPEWQLFALDGFLRSPALIGKLAALFRRPESNPERLLNLLNLKFADHSYAVIVPEGPDDQVDTSTAEFSGSIYTFPFSAC